MRRRLSHVRYGNVMYSGFSNPLFIRQIEEGIPITVTEPDMTRFMMPLSQSVELVKYSFEHAEQGDILIKKAAACTLNTLSTALKEIFGAPDHPVNIIGWRHGEKLYETLASSSELLGSEDLGDFIRLTADKRGLNYSKYITEGRSFGEADSDFHSHNARRMDVEETKELLHSLPEIQDKLMRK